MILHVGMVFGPLLWLALLGPREAAPGPRPVIDRPYVVALDAGHGGDNHGCTTADGSAWEKDVSLALARALEAELAQRLPQADVVLTRADDRTLALADRVAMANAARADVFVSLHANASPDHRQQGFETYVLDAKASSLDAAWTARRENEIATSSAPAPADAGTAAHRMAAELVATAHRASAAALARRIQLEQAERFPDRIDRGVKQARFDVLLGARMPAILFEAGFLDEPEEGAMLRDPDMQGRVVDGLADALVDHYRRTRRGAAD
jgi:N-acetylmuramoyl-L-alanine amidase